MASMTCLGTWSSATGWRFSSSLSVAIRLPSAAYTYERWASGPSSIGSGSPDPASPSQLTGTASAAVATAMTTPVTRMTATRRGRSLRMESLVEVERERDYPAGSQRPIMPRSRLRAMSGPSTTTTLAFAGAGRAGQVGATACRYDDLPGGVDAVVVATPPALHRREAERAVDGGALALVETPIAATPSEADEIVALGRRGRVAYAENLVHSPVVADAVQVCRRIGALTHLEVRFAQGLPESSAARLDPSWGGGVLLDLGIHALAGAVFMAAPARGIAVQAPPRARDGV